jgi:microcystin-dependent protein
MESYLGTIILFAGNFAPRGWSYCDGSLLQINTNQAMFAILGTMYGGDGRTTFGLPNIAPIVNSVDSDAPLKYIICMQGIFPSRD